MRYYAFNNNEPLNYGNKTNPFIMIHYCQNCNTEVIGEWVLNEKKKIKVTQKKEVANFINLENCPICGEQFDEKIEHHYVNSLFGFVLGSADSFSSPLVKRDLFFNFSVPYNDLPNGLGPTLEKGQEFMTKYGPLVVRYNDIKHSKVFALCHNNTPSILSFLEYFRLQECNQVVEIKMNQFIEKVLLNSENIRIDGFDSKSDFNLKGYLEQLLLIEENIFSISKRLGELYAMDYNAERDILASEKLMILKYPPLIKDALEEYKDLTSKNVEKDITIKDFPITYPNEPQMPKEPVKPVLATPGFFNKKRISAENTLLTEKYKKELEIYDMSVKKYELDLKRHRETIVLLENQREEKYKLAIETAKDTLEKEISIAREKYEDLLEKQNAAENSARDTPTIEKAKHLLLKEEIEIAEELLKKFYKAQNEMYSCGVIFEKYRNFVAISSFYEYISSGRCETLEGANGAYNLYENEIRMNMVIGQLNQVIESLEEIKQNQYIIYSAIQKTNRQLSSLNSSMGSAIRTLSSISADTSDMKSYMSKIADNTEVIAYNTEKTAFYAKKNAELTNALGFMLALR